MMMRPPSAQRRPRPRCSARLNVIKQPGDRPSDLTTSLLIGQRSHLLIEALALFPQLLGAQSEHVVV
jgi:hypothetical protein